MIAEVIDKFSHFILRIFLHYDGIMYWSWPAVLKKKHLLGKFSPKYRPFCPMCFEDRNRFIHLMKGCGKVAYKCLSCDWYFGWGTDKESLW